MMVVDFLKLGFKDRYVLNKALVSGAAVGALLGFIMPACFQADKLQAAALALAPEWTSALVSIGSAAGVFVIAFTIAGGMVFERDEDDKVQYKNDVQNYTNDTDMRGNAVKARTVINSQKRLMISAAVAIGANVLTNILLAALSSQSLLDITYAGSLHSTMSMSIFAAGFSALAGISAYALQDEQMRNKFAASMAVGTVAAIVGLILSSTIASNLGFSLATTGLTHEMSSALIGCAFGAAAAGITALVANREEIGKFFKKAFPGRKPNPVVDPESSDENEIVPQNLSSFYRQFT